MLKKIWAEIQRQYNWGRMDEIDRRIARAERDMILAHAEWQSLLAAKKADEQARQESQLMIKQVHARFGFSEKSA
jgi:cellobiose-specific phosphotransferase system component IIA